MKKPRTAYQVIKISGQAVQSASRIPVPGDWFFVEGMTGNWQFGFEDGLLMDMRKRMYVLGPFDYLTVFNNDSNEPRSLTIVIGSGPCPRFASSADDCQLVTTSSDISVGVGVVTQLWSDSALVKRVHISIPTGVIFLRIGDFATNVSRGIALQAGIGPFTLHTGNSIYAYNNGAGPCPISVTREI